MGAYVRTGNEKKITIKQCLTALENLRNGKDIPSDIILDTPQQRFLKCVVISEKLGFIRK